MRQRQSEDEPTNAEMLTGSGDAAPVEHEDLRRSKNALSNVIMDIKDLAVLPSTPERAQHMAHLADCGRFLLEAISFLDSSTRRP